VSMLTAGNNSHAGRKDDCCGLSRRDSPVPPSGN
jgi:hypothetical protein